MFLLLLRPILSFPPSIIPYPNEISVLSGQFQLTSDAQIGYDPSIAQADTLAAFAASELTRATGFALPIVPTRPETGIYFGSIKAADGEYYLNFTSTVAQIYGSTRTSLFYGLQSLLQLFPPELQTKYVVQVPWVARNVSIHDSPRLSWRGAMVDCSRHFVDIATLKSVIDSIARYKMNVFHFHLVDDQGWRFESKKFPELVQKGADRDSSPVRFHRLEQDGIPYGPFYYTQDEIRDLIAYAHEREITIVPEIEMPGHSLAALAAFPSFTCEGGPFRPLTIWGGDDHTYCPGNDDTIRFLEELLDEVMTVFDSNVIHVGGDEVSHKLWETCPKCQARMKEHNLKTTDELQSWFIAHFAQYLASKGHRCIGWDEILQGGLPDATMVMSWTGVQGGIAAAQLGHEVVMSPQQVIYLDRYQFRGKDKFEYFWTGVDPLNAVYKYNPTDGVEDQYKKFIVGIQGNLWTEYVWSTEQIEWKIFPRVSAIAEVGWTNTANLNWNSYVTRLTLSEFKKLDIRGIRHASISTGLPADWQPGEIPTKATTLEWDLAGSIGEPGTYEIMFVYEGGKNPMKVSNVRLSINGTEAAADYHTGVVFDPASDNVWKFITKVSAINLDVNMTATVACDGGSDSYGKIYVYST